MKHPRCLPRFRQRRQRGGRPCLRWIRQALSTMSLSSLEYHAWEADKDRPPCGGTSTMSTTAPADDTSTMPAEISTTTPATETTMSSLSSIDSTDAFYDEDVFAGDFDHVDDSAGG